MASQFVDLPLEGGGSESGIVVNTTTITGGVSGQLLYDNAGTVGEAAGTNWDGANLTVPNEIITNGGTSSPFHIGLMNGPFWWDGTNVVFGGQSTINPTTGLATMFGGYQLPATFSVSEYPPSVTGAIIGFSNNAGGVGAPNVPFQSIVIGSGTDATCGGALGSQGENAVIEWLKGRQLWLSGSPVMINGLTYPSVDGSPNQVITTDGAGVLSFANPGNPFDQSLNTSDSPSFDRIISTGTDVNFKSGVYGLEYWVSSDGTPGGTLIAGITATTFSLFGASPAAQQTTAITPAPFVANTSGIVDDSATWDGYTIGQIVTALRAYGLLA